MTLPQPVIAVAPNLPFSQPLRFLSRYAAGVALFLCGLAVPPGHAQTDFAPGEIMFTGYNSDNPDWFSVVLLNDVQLGTVIFISDRGWSSTNGFRIDNSGEGVISLTFGGDYSCGTTIVFRAVGGNPAWQAADDHGDSVGTIAWVAGDPAGPVLGTDGDQLFIYQEPTPTVGNQTSFVTMIQMDNNLFGGVDQDSESQLPSGLALNQLVRFNQEYDAAKYDCSPNIDTPVNL